MKMMKKFLAVITLAKFISNMMFATAKNTNGYAAPSTPENVTYETKTDDSISLIWDEPNDFNGVAGYSIYRGWEEYWHFFS